MKSVRLLPVVVMAIAALLVFKTIGLVTNGGYVLAGVTSARAAGASSGGDAAATETGEAVLEDASPTLSDNAPTLGGPEAAPAEGEHGEAAPADVPAADHAAAALTSDNCVAVDAAVDENGAVSASQGSGGGHGETAPAESAGNASASSFVDSMLIDCFPSGDAVPMQVDASGAPVPMTNVQGGSATEESILQSLAARRTELETYEKDLALRASLVDAAEKRVAERQATLEALEAQISSLVDQRQEMEAGQFASIVAMYETMKPRDAANIFNALEMDVLLRVAKMMNPRKMAPILAAMEATRAQELTVRMAALADQPAAEMTPDDLQALPQIEGQ